MGKIVKFCAACDESFAEKFAFCPNCGQVMTAFEMNPLAAAETKISDAPAANFGNAETIEPENNLNVPASAPFVAETSPHVEIPMVAEAQDFSAVNQTPTSFDDVEVEENLTDDYTPETKTFAATAGTNGDGDSYQTNDDVRQPIFNNQGKSLNDGYNITVIEEKNVNQRNGLLLATMVLMVSVVLGATVFSLFNRDLLVGAIDQDSPFYVSVIEDVPMEVEEQPKKDDDDGGGGGGGGKEEPEPPSKGRLPTQTKEPLNPPSVNVPQLTNPTLRYDMSTQGTITRPRTAERIGLPGSDNLNPSNGPGRGGGVGSGTGVGIGTGNGTGEGSGTGSGSGSGTGSGNGGGTGPGSGIPKAPPPPPPVGVTQKLKIISKPKPGYTDAARQNQVTGTVRLRVMFTASGQIGSISPVSGLPYGLTEQAIAAARGIKFEPAKRNGVPVPSQSIVEYSFSIY